eukprot:6838212-Lingulodinium_polyedra.AAC.1
MHIRALSMSTPLCIKAWASAPRLCQHGLSLATRPGVPPTLPPSADAALHSPCDECSLPGFPPPQPPL